MDKQHRGVESLDLSVFRESIKAFFDARGTSHPDLPVGTRFLVVDDEPFVADAVKMMIEFDGHNVETASSARRALEAYATREFDIIVTDYAMPQMKGDELAMKIKEKNPDMPVVLITAYAEMLQASRSLALNILDGVVSKPFLLDDLRASLAMALPRPLSKQDEEWMTSFRSFGALLMINRAACAYAHILQSLYSSTDLAHVMLRHKAKHILITYLDSLGPYETGRQLTNSLFDQLSALRRFCELSPWRDNVGILKFLKPLIADFRKAYGQIKLESQLDRRLSAIILPAANVALLALIIGELFGNAVEALKAKGVIHLQIDVLASKNLLLIKVRDNGPGVTKGTEDTIFTQHVSTHGPGRGLGLHLIREGAIKLGGNVDYAFESGAAFRVLIPIPPQERRIASLLRAAKGYFRPSKKTTKKVTRLARICVSYSHRDENLRRRLDVNLKILQNQGLVVSWHDRNITPGELWVDAIDDEFRQADLILLLISPDFLASDYCQKIETKIALDRRALGEATVIPIILRACDWKTHRFGTLQALPKDGKPITSWTNRDEAWNDVALGIKMSLEKLLKKF